MRKLHDGREPPQCQGMVNLTDLASVPSPPSTCAALRCPPSHRPWGSPTCSPGPAHRRPAVGRSVRLRAGGHARAARLVDLRGHRRRHRRPRRGARPPGATGMRQGHQGGSSPAAPGRRAGYRPATGDRVRGPILLNSRGIRMDRHAATRRLHRLAGAAGIQAARAHPHMLRHTFVTTMLDAGVGLRDVQITPVTPTRARLCGMTGPARTWTATRTTSSPPSWPPAPDRNLRLPQPGPRGEVRIADERVGALPHSLTPSTPLLRWWRQEVSP